MNAKNYNNLITRLDNEIQSPKWFEELKGRHNTVLFKALWAVRDGLKLHQPFYEENNPKPLCEECTAISYRREAWPCETALTLGNGLEV